MYVVIDKKQLPPVQTREAADILLESLQNRQPECDWAVCLVVQPSADSEVLERLYSLSDTLLRATKANPYKMALTVMGLDGVEREYSAVQVMNSAREWIDGMQQVAS